MTLDSSGNATQITDSNLKSVSYQFGSVNQLLSLSGTGGLSSQYRYDDAGRIFETVLGNGLKAIYSYDNAGRISQIADPGNPNNTVLFYSYDQNGNLTQSSSMDGQQTFGYDALNRLTSWTNEAGSVTNYSYDAVGNLTAKGAQSFAYNSANQITNAGYTFDSNGNLTSDGTNNYQYDASNRLVRVTRVAGGTLVAEYEYDYRDLRVKKTTPTQTIRYHWDALSRLVRESDANGNTLARYIWKDQNQLAAIEKGGALYYPHFSYRGDLLAVTNSAGTRVATYKYGPWGELLSTTGTFQQPWRYAGYYLDEETGLYYVQARYYNPANARFLTKDPVLGNLTNPQSLNRYVYALNNPVVNVDPDGRIAGPVGAVIGAGFGSMLGVAVADYYGLTGWKRWATIGGFSVGSGVIGWFAGPVVARLASSLIPLTLTRVAPEVARLNDNKIHHIRDNADHAWDLIMKNPDWGKISRVMSYVLQNGTEGRYKSVWSKTAKIGKHVVEVTYNKLADGTIAVSDAWVRR